ncbi:MAG: glycosyltransferase family 4 protein [Acidimicrobiia bacterium]|nr:glycosyltransferase family 4 protein [Acidimicrobiia bacterium]
MPTTVLVDGWHLAGTSAQRGIGTYLRGVLPLVSSEHGLEVVALAPDGTRLPDGVSSYRIARRAPGRFAQREHDLRLPHDITRAAKRTGADVFFSPADNPPSRTPLPWVQMLHDVIPLAVGDPAMAQDAARWRQLAPRLRSADAIVTNSRCTADDAVRFLDVDPARLHVSPLGVDPRFRPPDEPVHGTPPTILYVGEYGPHKGFAEAFAVAAAVAHAGLPHRLAMVGSLAPWYRPVVEELLAGSARPDRVDLLDYVEDIVRAYQQADALIVTSSYEGFCFPALEAMACGTPVVAFSNSALPEVLGDAGTLIPDGDVDAFAAALVHLLAEPTARAHASARGIERARTFTWDRCARTHAEVLRSVAR